MSPEIETRLGVLLDAARARLGNDILTNRDRLTLFLIGEAPELSDQARAVAAALAMDAVWRLGPAPAPEALQPIVTEVARRVNIQPATAAVGVRVAARVAGASNVPPPPPVAAAEGSAAVAPVQPVARDAGNNWVGDSVVAAQPAQRASPGADRHAGAGSGTGQDDASQGGLPQPLRQILASFGSGGGSGSFDLKTLLQNKWVLGGIAVIVIALALGDQSGTPQPPPQPAQPTPSPAGPAAPGGGGGQQAGTLPMLANPQQGGQLPTLQMNNNQAGTGLMFGMRTEAGALRGSVLVSSQGWDGGVVVAFAGPNAREPETLSVPQPAALHRMQQGAARVVQPQWQFDRVGIRDICVTFQQSGATDVTLRGSVMCVYSANCAQVIGCGRVP